MDVRNEVRRLAEPLAEEAGYELVDVELVVPGGQRVVRVLLDKPGGITLGDCAAFSRRLGDGLDMNQTVPGSYRLEVSSPGLDRPVTSLEAVARFAGRRAMLTTVVPREGRRHYEGALLEPREGSCGIRTDDGAEHRFEWPEVKSIRLVVDPWERSRSGAPGGNGPARGADRGTRLRGASRRSRGGAR